MREDIKLNEERYMLRKAAVSAAVEEMEIL